VAIVRGVDPMVLTDGSSSVREHLLRSPREDLFR
jgi:hypothetical protein